MEHFLFKYLQEEKLIENEKLEYFRKKNEYATLGKQEKSFIFPLAIGQ